MIISIANYNFFMIPKKERLITIITWINQLAPFVGSKSCVTGKIIHKPYLKKQLSNYLRSLHFHSKLVSWLLFQSRLPLLQRFIETVHPATFSFKIVMFATFLSKLSSSLLFHFFKTVKFTTLSFETVYFVFFMRHCWAHYFFYFFKTGNFANFLFETVKFPTFIQNCLVCHFFIRKCQTRYFFLQNWQTRYFFIQSCPVFHFH